MTLFWQKRALIADGVSLPPSGQGFPANEAPEGAGCARASRSTAQRAAPGLPGQRRNHAGRVTRAVRKTLRGVRPTRCGDGAPVVARDGWQGARRERFGERGQEQRARRRSRSAVCNGRRRPLAHRPRGAEQGARGHGYGETRARDPRSDGTDPGRSGATNSSCKGESRPSRAPCACLTVPTQASVSWAAKAF